MQDEISGWNDWTASFGEIDELSSVSELHGFITGVLCTTSLPNEKDWRAILKLLDIQEVSDEMVQLIHEEAEDIAAALNEGELDYLPLLPDDEHILQERVDALASWCSGVVVGFGLTCGEVSSEEAELIESLQDVAAVDFSEQDDDEQGEESYNEIYEFVRLIPLSLSMDRQKREFVLTNSKNEKSAVENSSVDVVEMFTPNKLN